jgi:hypothetical protein
LASEVPIVSDDAAQSGRPRVNADGLTKRLLLQMELMRHHAQLQNFAPVRDHLTTSGQDADARYRQIQSRRDDIVAELKRTSPRTRAQAPRPSTLPWHRGLPMSSPIAAARFDLGTIGPWFGFAGTVQMGRAQTGISVFPPGTTGVIETLALDDNGGVFFTGDIAAMPIEGRPTNPGTFVEVDQYFWLQNWSYVIPFPAPAVESTLTYSFDVLVQVATELVDRSAFGWSYVSVGETANFTGQEIVVDTGAGFPLAMVDLNPPTGLVRGRSAVQRSFGVGAGHRPAVAVIVGFAAGLERGAEAIFDDQHDCFILPGTEASGQGAVDFRYDAVPVLAQP